MIPGARPTTTSAAEPVVKAVLFYVPTCRHCHKVMEEYLPPVMARYGERLQIAFVGASEPKGGELFHATGDHFGIPEASRGVPLMVVCS